jgi:hypothetical protein
LRPDGEVSRRDNRFIGFGNFIVTARYLRLTDVRRETKSGASGRRRKKLFNLFFHII